MEKYIVSGYLKYDLVGQKFSDLTVIELDAARNNKDYGTWWKCQCTCGNIVIRKSQGLREGRSKNCGCKRYLPIGESSFNRLYSGLALRARGKNISFALTEIQARTLFTSDCFYCGRPPASIRTGWSLRGEFIYNGIDRVDNSLGYIIGNCVPCCGDCNRSKATMSQREFYLLISNIYSRVGNHANG